MVNTLNGTGFDLAPKGILFREIRAFASLNFNSVSFNFSPRACNKLAHALAAYGARRQVVQERWSKDLPDDVHVREASILAGPVRSMEYSVPSQKKKVCCNKGTVASSQFFFIW